MYPDMPADTRTFSEGSNVLCAKYNSDIVSKVLWVPTHDQHLEQATKFLTGSKQAENNENFIQLWSYVPEPRDESMEGAEMSDGPDLCLLGDKMHGASVNDMKFLDSERVVVADGRGGVSMYKVSGESGEVSQVSRLHPHAPHSCSALSCDMNDCQHVVSVGEDSVLHVLDVEQGKAVHTIKPADSTALLSVCHSGVNQALTGSMAGLIKLWDFRSKPSRPQAVYVNSQCSGVTCVTPHPVQSHVIFAATSLGTLCLLDLRQTFDMHTQMKAHDAAVNDILIHPYQPEHLITCSDDGDLWHWDASGLNRFLGTSAGSNVWYECSAHSEHLSIRSLLESGVTSVTSVTSVNSVTSVMGVTSVSVERDLLLASTEGAQLILMRLHQLS